jgi:hypothetical protein
MKVDTQLLYAEIKENNVITYSFRQILYALLEEVEALRVVESPMSRPKEEEDIF